MRPKTWTHHLFVTTAFLVLVSDSSSGFGRNDTDPGTVVEGMTAFACDLYARLREKPGNLFLSPYSISASAAMVYAGARGDTEHQMARALHFGTDQERFHRQFAGLDTQIERTAAQGEIELAVANGLWVQEGHLFRRDYLELVERYHGAALQRVDFREQPDAIRGRINTWVEEQTRDRIQDLIAPGVLSTLTRMVLVNAIYFKGAWETAFARDATQDRPFHLLSGATIEVPTMTRRDTFRYAAGDGLQILELPYTGEQMSMLILLPEETGGIAELERRLTAENLAGWLGMPAESEIVVYMPRFRITSQFGLASTLAAMGMPDAFGSRADFSGIDGTRDLFVSAVVHKAFVEVNEEGTEAAAATAWDVSVTVAEPLPPPVFRADHPFLFLIRHVPSGSVLFMGRVEDPSA